MKYKSVLTLTMIGLLTGCGVDKNNPKYDQLRYDELQKANCHDMAAVLSAPVIMDKPEEFDTALKRCQDTQSLSFEEYKDFADQARATGNWDIYQVYPEKQ